MELPRNARTVEVRQATVKAQPRFDTVCKSTAMCGASLTDEPRQGSSAVMNDAPDDRELAKRKFLGRAMVIGFLVLVAVYATVTFLGRR